MPRFPASDEIRHVHQAVQDPQECIAMCPVCSPDNVPAYKLVPASQTATTAYQTIQGILDRRKQEQAARATQKAARTEELDDRKARQTKLF